MLYLNMSENKELQGDIGDLVSGVSSKTSILDLFLTDTGLTGRTNSSSIDFFRDVAWGTEDMGLLEMNRSGSRNFELESKYFGLSGVTSLPKKGPASNFNQIGATMVGGVFLLLKLCIREGARTERG